MKKKVIIVGGGITGLSAAHFLSDYNDFDIELYESENDIGGQARSMLGKYCYIEYSWRVFGVCYKNINNIINKIGADKNFELLNFPCIIDSNQNLKSLKVTELTKSFLKKSNFKNINRLLNIFTICRERAINDYDNINAYEYFNKHPLMQTILGPFLGMEANKTSLSGYYKNVLSIREPQYNHFTPKNTRISKYPTQNSLFIPWVNYLKKKGVKIYTNSELTNIYINNNKIEHLEINKKGVPEIINGDEFIFACSLKNLNKIINKNNFFTNLKITNNLKKLEEGLQLYYTINLYFSENLISNKDICNELILVDTPWKLIIQRKYLWSNKYMKSCSKNIKDVFNIGFLDLNKGSLYNKELNKCSKMEAIQEGIYQFKNSKYIKNILKQKKTSFDNIYVGYEDWYEFQNNKKGNLISLNPKFSMNTNLLKYMPNNTIINKELPNNMTLAGYYVKSTMGGVSMESSCETGLNSGLIVIKKYNYKVKEYPYNHNSQYFSILTIIYVYLDKLLYYLNMKPLNEYIPSSILILFIICVIIIIILLTIKFFIKYI
jgi:hypothetical protein